MTYVKKSRTKLYIGVLLVAILAVAAVAAAYAIMSAPAPVAVGVHVGDTFTYSIQGDSESGDIDTQPTPGFEIYNQTDYFKVTITDVKDTHVSMDTTWRFLNGSEINLTQIIDIANGNKTDEDGFWALYPADLPVGNLLRPRGFDGNVVNSTSTKVYTGGGRETSLWFINNQFYNINDPTQSTMMYDYRSIYFDKATGMLTEYYEYMLYNNPQRQETIIWKLTDSSVWQI
jgi:hypothetical protein